MRTLEEAMEFYAKRMDEVHAETVERNFAGMVADGLTDDAIGDFQKIEAATYQATRVDVLAKVRQWLERDGESVQ